MIKKIIFTVFTFVLTIGLFASCASSGIYLVNQSHTLNKNGLIILKLYGNSQELLGELTKKYPVFLISSTKKKVGMKIVSEYKGEFRITQVVLQPLEELQSNENYELDIQNLPDETMHYGIYPKKDFVFKTNSMVDDTPPLLSSLPVETEKELIYYGCGPAIWTSFKFDAKDESELFVLARVKNSITNKETTCIVNLKDGIAKIGHGMCSGEFNYDPGTQLEVSFRLADQSGNLSNWTDVIKFTAPTTSTNED